MTETSILITGQDGRFTPVAEGLFALEAIIYPPEQTEAATVDLVRVLQEVADERWRQDLQWGGAAHDDEHDHVDWHRVLSSHVDRLLVYPEREMDPPSDFRLRLLKIAALAVAAAQSFDRLNAPGEAGEVVEATATGEG